MQQSEHHWGRRAWQALHQPQLLPSVPLPANRPVESGQQGVRARKGGGKVGPGRPGGAQWLPTLHRALAPAWAPSGGSGQCKARASLPARAALGSAPRTGALSRSPRHTLHPKPLVLLRQQWKAQGWGSCSCPLQGQCCTCPGAPWDLAAFVTLLLCSDTGLASVLYSVSSAFAPHESRYRGAFAPAD